MNNFVNSSIMAATLASTIAADHMLRSYRHNVTMADYETLTFENKLDHFSETDERTYQQRYWSNDKYFDSEATSGTVFLYMCGEWTCSPPDEQMFPMMVGAEHGALLYSLEHRYYGSSQPFDNWDTANFEWHTSE